MAKKFSIDISVRFRDIDAMGHVNNSVYFTYFEEGRKEFYHTLIGISGIEDIDFILAHIQCDFHKPITINDPLAVRLWINDVGKKRFNFEYELINRDDDSIIYARGHSVQVFFDYQKNKTKPGSEKFLEKVSDYIHQT